MMLEALNVIGTLLIGLAGLYFTHNFSRQIKQKTADSRMKAYAKLWEKLYPARPTRLWDWDAEELNGPLIKEERDQLFVALTSWYYKKGNGMYLGDNTRNIYLTAKHNLVCDIEDFEPKGLQQILMNEQSADEQERLRGTWSIKQLSLLRARMRADLEVYGLLYDASLEKEEKLFLEHCGENWRKKPWNPASPT